MNGLSLFQRLVRLQITLFLPVGFNLVIPELSTSVAYCHAPQQTFTNHYISGCSLEVGQGFHIAPVATPEEIPHSEKDSASRNSNFDTFQIAIVMAHWNLREN